MLEGFTIKLADLSDMKDVFELSNDDLVRHNSFNQEKIIWENHVKWFEKKIKDINVNFNIFRSKKDNTIAGYIKLEKEEDSNWIVTIHISPSFRGKGYGTLFLRQVSELNPEKVLVGYVKTNNFPSYKAFINAGFKSISKKILNNTKVYELKKNGCNSDK